MTVPLSSAAEQETPEASAEGFPTGAQAAELGGPVSPPARNYVKLGLGLMLLAGVLWAPLPVLPFLPLSASAKVAIGTVLFIAVQIAWWGGTVLAGPATVRKVYALFRKLKWWKKPPSGDSLEAPPAA